MMLDAFGNSIRVWDDVTVDIPSGPVRIMRILDALDTAEVAMREALEETPDKDVDGCGYVTGILSSIKDAADYFRTVGEFDAQG